MNAQDAKKLTRKSFRNQLDQIFKYISHATTLSRTQIIQANLTIKNKKKLQQLGYKITQRGNGVFTEISWK